MRKIRIGKDIVFHWKILTNGVASSLEGRNLSLELRNPGGRFISLPVSVNGNVVTSVFRGVSQKQVGSYTLTLWENKGKHGQNAVDSVDAFRLVLYSTDEEDCVCGDLQSETVDLGTSSLTITVAAGDVFSGSLLEKLYGSELFAVLLDGNLHTVTYETIMNGAVGGGGLSASVDGEMLILTGQNIQVNGSVLELC